MASKFWATMVILSILVITLAYYGPSLFQYSFVEYEPPSLSDLTSDVDLVPSRDIAWKTVSWECDTRDDKYHMTVEVEDLEFVETSQVTVELDGTKIGPPRTFWSEEVIGRGNKGTLSIHSTSVGSHSIKLSYPDTKPVSVIASC